jgi:hypothetical protein
MKYATELISGNHFGRLLLRRAGDGEQTKKFRVRCDISTHVFDTIEEARAYAAKSQEHLRRRRERETPGCVLKEE